MMSGWFLLASAIVQYQRKIKLLNEIKLILIFPHSGCIRRNTPLRISPYSVRMREIADQKYFEYGYFSHCALASTESNVALTIKLLGIHRCR